MTYNVKISVHTIPLTGFWGSGQWCKAGDVAHLCSIMVQMYRALDEVNGHLGLNDRERETIAFALKRANKVMP